MKATRGASSGETQHVHVCETKNIDLFNKVHVFETMQVHTFGFIIRLIRLFSLMLNYTKPRISLKRNDGWVNERRPTVGDVGNTAHCMRADIFWERT